MKKFKIMYPEDHFEVDKRGKPYKPPQGSMIVMNNGGVFFLYNRSDPYHPFLQKLSEVLRKYDVVWKD